ncbi:MAG: DUF547 domain-containing protein [Deltaproteobacteria bacterium]|nr:DUF547 domain-containing protein [Deltaproteobacteria bacterium]
MNKSLSYALFWLLATPFAMEAQELLDASKYATVLTIHLDSKGQVDYKALKEDRAPLDQFLEGIDKLDKKIYEVWTPHEKIAFWINAYNSRTLQVIIDHYPMQPGLLPSLRFPKNSIRQIPGVWDELRFPVMGQDKTLGEIEHQILRKEFSEPRIHMALVCAAKGCPPLRNEPYSGAKLSQQLDDQTRRFVSNPQKFRIDQANGTVYLSPIFKWFREDFEASYGTVINFIQRYLTETDRQFLIAKELDLKYLDYDWSLNEQE